MVHPAESTASAFNIKPGEPPFRMKLDFQPGNQAGTITVKYKIGMPSPIQVSITNTTVERQAYKVKVTDNKVFTIKPVMGVLAQGESVPITITFKTGKPAENNRHYLALYHMRCHTAIMYTKAKDIWKIGRADGITRVIVRFEAEFYWSAGQIRKHGISLQRTSGNTYRLSRFKSQK